MGDLLAQRFRVEAHNDNRRLIAIAVLAAFCLAGARPAAAVPLVIPVLCPAHVGDIIVDIIPGGVAGGFVSNTGGLPRFSPELHSAAVVCGEDHFNSLSQIRFDNHPPVDAAGNRLFSSYDDPPPGGYGNDPNTPGDDTQWADKFPWYWDEEDPPIGTSGGGNHLRDRQLDLDNDGAKEFLQYGDTPHGIADTQLEIVVTLVSLNADGSLHSRHGGFIWNWSNASGQNVATDLEEFVPEPSIGQLLGIGSIGLVLAGAWRRRRRLT